MYEDVFCIAIQCERSPISKPKPMTPMCQFFLVNQKHTAQPVTSDSQANDTYDSVLFLIIKKGWAVSNLIWLVYWSESHIFTVVFGCS